MDRRVSSSIDLQFGELTERLDRWRKDTVAVAALGVPPHITLLYPWRKAPFKKGDLRQLEEVLKGFGPFELCFDRLGTFETGVVYLALEDERRPRELMKALQKAFPDTPPYGGAFADPPPHLTVAKSLTSDLDRMKDEIAAALDLPLNLYAGEVVAMEEGEDGQWFDRHTVGL